MARIAALAVAALAAFQQGPKEQLRGVLKDTEVRGAWIYDDLDAGFAEAKKSGKPLLVVFR